MILQDRAPQEFSFIARHISEIRGGYTLRISVTVIFTEKLIFITAVGGDFGTCESEKAFGYLFIVYLFICLQCIEVSVDLLYNPILLKQCAGYEQRILKIYLILFVIIMIGELCISRKSKIPCTSDLLVTESPQTS